MSLDACCRCCGFRPAEGCDLRTCCEPPYGHYSCQQMLSECFNLFLSSEVGAHGVCDRCISQLTDSWQFRQQVVRTENFLLLTKQGGCSPRWEDATHSPTAAQPILPERDAVLLTKHLIEPTRSEDKHLFDNKNISNETVTEKCHSNKIVIAKRSQKKDSFNYDIISQRMKRLDEAMDTAKTSESGVKTAARIGTKSKRKTKIFTPASFKRIKIKPKTYNCQPIRTYIDTSTPPVVEGDAKRASAANAALIVQLSNVCPFKVKNNEYLCFYCDRPFSEPNKLREHTASDHKPGAARKNTPQLLKKVDVTELKCRLCAENITDVASLKGHLVEKHQKRFYPGNDGILPFKLSSDGFRCAMCEKTFQLFNAVNQHMNEHFPNFVCEMCGLGFAEEQRLNAHKSKHEARKFACERCGKEFQSRQAKKAHEDRVHDGRGHIKCTHCRETFVSYEKRRSHLEIAHGKARRTFSCARCEKLFASKRLVTNHMQKEHIYAC